MLAAIVHVPFLPACLSVRSIFGGSSSGGGGGARIFFRKRYLCFDTENGDMFLSAVKPTECITWMFFLWFSGRDFGRIDCALSKCTRLTRRVWGRGGEGKAARSILLLRVHAWVITPPALPARLSALNVIKDKSLGSAIQKLENMLNVWP